MWPAAAPLHPMPTRLRSLRNISLFFNQNIMCEVSGRTRVDWNPQLKKFRLVYLWSAAPQTSGCRETPGGCENADSGMVGLAWGPRFCILYKFQGDDSDMLVCRPHFGLQRCIFWVRKYKIKNSVILQLSIITWKNDYLFKSHYVPLL